MNDGADRIRAEQRALGRSNDFNALDVAGAEMAEIEAAAESVGSHAVDEDERIVRRAAPGEQRRERTAAAARLVATGAGVTELADRLHLSGKIVRVLYDRCRN